MDLGTGVRRIPSAPKAQQHLAEQQRGIRGSISMPIAHNPQLPSSEKSARSKTMDGLRVHSFQGLLSELANRARVTYALKPGKSEEKTF